MEIHSGKLQQQLSLLNEKNLEIVRENEFMKSKLRVLEEIRMERNSMLPPPAHTRLGKSCPKVETGLYNTSSSHCHRT